MAEAEAAASAGSTSTGERGHWLRAILCEAARSGWTDRRGFE
jgi:hypothetical protein